MTYDQWKTDSGYAEKTPEQENEERDCPLCGGDCAAANPPVTNCPMQIKLPSHIDTIAAMLQDQCLDWNGAALADAAETRNPIYCGQLRALLKERASLRTNLRHWREECGKLHSQRDRLSRDIHASPAPDAVEPSVKALEWNAPDSWNIAQTIVGAYVVRPCLATNYNGQFVMRRPGEETSERYPTEDAAKAAAQADYDARIRSALAPTSPVSAPGVVEALKEACSVLETLVDPDSQHVSSATIWAQAIAASRKGRASLRSPAVESDR